MILYAPKTYLFVVLPFSTASNICSFKERMQFDTILDYKRKQASYYFLL